jgi:acetyltransferase-like isoleucine patch superfamily enzyme
MMLHLKIYNWVISKIFNFFFSRSFGGFGFKSRIISPIAIEGAENIFLGSYVFVAAHSCLAAVRLTESDSCKLRIGNGCKIGRFNHIYATNNITIENNVLTANNVYISDNLHDYKNIDIPILDQPIIQKSTVIIGEGSWLGHNSCIIGAKIGRNCVVGANSVVTRDIPDYSVVVGVPARVIKRFDTVSKIWRRTNPDGDFF